MSKVIKNSAIVTVTAMLIMLMAISQINAISSTDNCVSYPEGYNDTYEYVELFNGDEKYLKLEVVGLVNINGGKYVMKGSDRLAAVDFESAAKIRFIGNSGRGNDGFVDGDVNVKVYYDFNKDGDWADDGEYIGTMTHHISKRTNRAKYLKLAQDAVAYYNTNSYKADMFAISAYMHEFCKYSDYDCGGGVGVLETWSIYKYGVHGRSDCPDPANNPSHVAFFPEENQYSVMSYYEAQGYKGDAPDAKELDFWKNRVEKARAE